MLDSSQGHTPQSTALTKQGIFSELSETKKIAGPAFWPVKQPPTSWSNYDSWYSIRIGLEQAWTHALQSNPSSVVIPSLIASLNSFSSNLRLRITTLEEQQDENQRRPFLLVDKVSIHSMLELVEQLAQNLDQVYKLHKDESNPGKQLQFLNGDNQSRLRSTLLGYAEDAQYRRLPSKRDHDNGVKRLFAQQNTLYQAVYDMWHKGYDGKKTAGDYTTLEADVISATHREQAKRNAPYAAPALWVATGGLSACAWAAISHAAGESNRAGGCVIAAVVSVVFGLFSLIAAIGTTSLLREQKLDPENALRAVRELSLKATTMSA